MAVEGWRAYSVNVGSQTRRSVTEVPPETEVITEDRILYERLSNMRDYGEVVVKAPGLLIRHRKPIVQEWTEVTRFRLAPLTNRDYVNEDYPHVQAICGNGYSHQVPDFSCSCGHHAYDNPKAALERERVDGGMQGTVVLAKVQGYGKVVHHKHIYGNAHGWRSEWIQVEAIVAPVCRSGHRAEYLKMTTREYWVFDCAQLCSPSRAAHVEPLGPWIQMEANRLGCEIWDPNSGKIGEIKQDERAKDEWYEHSREYKGKELESGAVVNLADNGQVALTQSFSWGELREQEEEQDAPF